MGNEVQYLVAHNCIWRFGRGGLCTGLNYGHFDAEWEVVYHREEFHGGCEKMNGVVV